MKPAAAQTRLTIRDLFPAERLAHICDSASRHFEDHRTNEALLLVRPVVQALTTAENFDYRDRNATRALARIVSLFLQSAGASDPLANELRARQNGAYRAAGAEAAKPARGAEPFSPFVEARLHVATPQAVKRYVELARSGDLDNPPVKGP